MLPWRAGTWQAARSGTPVALALAICAAVACNGSATRPLNSITLESDTIWAPIGMARAVTAIGKDNLGRETSADITWTSSDPLVATAVNGVIRGLRFGTATLTASAPGVAPATATIAVLPPAGTYDVTASLNEFSFEVPGPVPPDCPQPGYCTLRRPYTGASLTGTLVIGNKGITTATFSGTFCDAASASDPSGCTHVSPKVPAEYANRIITYDGAAFVATMQVGDYSTPIIRLSSNSSNGDFAGSVYWSTYVSRSPPAHDGTFVARLRP